jgi:probable rRNA maturation factor
MGGDDARIAALNADFRGKTAPTNVLSWPADDLSPEAPGGAPAPPNPGTHDDPAELGDIALAFETCTGEAAAAGLPVDHHVLHLIVHGTLHLLGYDHVHDADATRMEATEVAILATLGVADPY